MDGGRRVGDVVERVLLRRRGAVRVRELRVHERAVRRRVVRRLRLVQERRRGLRRLVQERLHVGARLLRGLVQRDGVALLIGGEELQREVLRVLRLHRDEPEVLSRRHIEELRDAAAIDDRRADRRDPRLLGGSDGITRRVLRSCRAAHGHHGADREQTE